MSNCSLACRGFGKLFVGKFREKKGYPTLDVRRFCGGSHEESVVAVEKRTLWRIPPLFQKLLQRGNGLCAVRILSRGIGFRYPEGRFNAFHVVRGERQGVVGVEMLFERCRFECSNRVVEETFFVACKICRHEERPYRRHVVHGYILTIGCVENWSERVQTFARELLVGYLHYSVEAFLLTRRFIQAPPFHWNVRINYLFHRSLAHDGINDAQHRIKVFFIFRFRIERVEREEIPFAISRITRASLYRLIENAVSERLKFRVACVPTDFLQAHHRVSGVGRLVQVGAWRTGLRIEETT